MSSSDTAFVMPNGHSTESMTHPVSLTSEQVNLEESMKHNSNNSNNNATSNNTTNQTSMNSINENNNRSQNNTNENNSMFVNNNFRKASSAERMLNASYQHYTPEKVRNNINHKATTPIQERSFANNNNTYNNININRQHNNIINAEAKTARVETSNLNARSPLRTSFTQLENNYIRSDTVPMTSAANTFFPPTYHTMPPNLQKSKTNHNANDNNRSNNNISNTNSNAASSENVSTNINAINATNKGPDNTNNNKFNNINNINNNSNNNNNSNISNNIASKNSINTVNHLRQIRSTSLSQQKDLFLSSWAEAFAKKHLLCNFCQNVVVNPVQVLPLPVLACRVCARTRASGGPLSVIELPQSISAAIQEIVSHGNVSHENKRGHPADDIDNHPAIRRRDGNESAHVADNVLLSAEMLKANNNNSNSNNNNTEILKSVSTAFQSESQAKNSNSIQNLTSAEHVFANSINAATTRVEKHIHAEVFDDNEEQQLQEQLKEQEKQQHMSESQADHHHQNYHYHYEQNLLQAHQQQNLKENEQHREEQEEEEEEEEQYHEEEEEEYRQEKQEEQHHRQNSNDRMQKAAIEASMYALTVFNNTLNQLVEAENNERELINQKQSQTWTEFVKTVKAVMREWKNTPKPPSSRDLKMEADRLYESAHYEKALDLYNEAIRLQTTDRLTQARFLFGNRSAANFMARHYRDCIDDCLEVIRLEPQNVKMLSRAARAAATMGELPLAVSLMERVGAERMTETMRLEFEKYKLGLEMYNKAEKLFGTDEADEPFRMLIAQFPETLLFRERYGASLMKRKHYSKAVEVFEVINAKIRPSKVRFLMSDSLYHMGFEHFQRARELLAPAAGIHDDCTQLLHIIDKVDDGKQRGNNNFAQKNFTAAVENYSEAIRFATDNDQILRILFCNRAAANKEIGRFREGVEDCTKALKIDPQFAKAYARRARCHAHLNDPYTAVEDFKRAVELDSDDKDLLKELRNAEAVLAREAEREKDYYYQLGLSRGATEREIRLKYKELSLRWHPDKCVALGPVEKERAEHKFKVISEAYTVLMDPAKRREYELKFDRERYFKPAFQSYSTTFSHSNEYFRGPRHRAGPSGYW